MSEYPVHVEKVQAPPLRSDILARDRLLDWLAVKVHNRVVLVTAEAGYGKTTLLADFARRSRLRVLWFRLDHGDRDWVGFIAYLVAAVRVHVPDFGPATASLLRETGSTAPPRDSVLDTFLRELGELPSEPAALVFDDFHLVDDAPDVRHVVKELLARAPERLSFVFASRRLPPLRLARLRALGEIAELRTDDLRFDATETERLFSEAYEMRLEPALIAELSRRTEGWAASLQLVHAALHDRDAAGIRSFIRSLSGAEGHLYDYLAEEVVGDLPEELQEFLMRTSLLDTVDLVLGPVAADVSADVARRLVEEGERLGLFGRQAAATRHQVRAHPLVRDFLRARLARSIGQSAVEAIHRRIATAAEAVDWRVAAHHYLSAHAPDDARRVLSDALETILATGAYAAAHQVAVNLPQEGPTAVLEIVASRVALKNGETGLAARHAQTAVSLEPDSDLAVWNAMMVLFTGSSFDKVAALAARLRDLPTSEFRLLTANAVMAGLRASVNGDLREADGLLLRAGDAAGRAGQLHFVGVALANAAQMRRAMGDADTALDLAQRAVEALQTTSAGIELMSAWLVQGWALAHLGRLDEARAVIDQARTVSASRLEFAIEAADVEVFYGSVEAAGSLLAPFEADLDPSEDFDEQALLTLIAIDLRRGRHAAAAHRVGLLAFGRPSTTPALEVRRRVARAQVGLVTGRPGVEVEVADAARLAASQNARIWGNYLAVLGMIDRFEPSGEWASVPPVYLSMAAEHVVPSLSRSTALADRVLPEATSRPERWQPPLRQALSSDDQGVAIAAGSILDEVGTDVDVAPLRRLARQSRISPGAPALGRRLARRLAAHVRIEDLGHVEIHVGSRSVQGVDVRRRVLELLCFLITRPSMRAQREEVVDALWPAHDPSSALNSLNQTVYFLRRVFELEYSEDLSPGYVGQNSEFVWLDAELISCRSHDCRVLIADAIKSRSADAAIVAAHAYRGKFALDFLYEDWAAPYREALHAAFLHMVETSLRSDIDAGVFSRGVELARKAAEVEPDSEQIQIALVRLYRLSGAHAAASEQYGRYSSVMRDLGVEPTAIDEV